jgi:hypothetical protein
MITDALAQVDLIASLHLEALFKMGHLANAGDQSNRVTDSVMATPDSAEPDSLRLRHRLAVIQTLAVRAQGLTIKTDMAQDASTRRNDTVSSASPTKRSS